VFALAIGMLTWRLAGSLPVALVLVGLTAVVEGPVMAAVFSLRQQLTPSDLQAQVMGTLGSVQIASVVQPIWNDGKKAVTDPVDCPVCRTASSTCESCNFNSVIPPIFETATHASTIIIDIFKMNWNRSVTSTPVLLPPDNKRGEPKISSYGLASFYRHHTRTASGEKFDERELTAAHRTLPFGTRLRVTSVETGRSVTVRVNDRGPFVRGRVVDLSYSAAQEIGMVGRGVTKVKVDVVQ